MRPRSAFTLLVYALFAAPALAQVTQHELRPATCGNSTGKLPLGELGPALYKGFQGGYYPGGANVPPQDHLADALALAAMIEPLDSAGNPDAVCGRIGVISIGLSNTSQEFAVFERQEDLNPERDPRIVIANAAQGGQSAENITDPQASYWLDDVRPRVEAAGLGSSTGGGVFSWQVQVVWMMEAQQGPPDDFPGHAMVLRDDLEQIVQLCKLRFPNLKICYLSNRTYGGYTNGNPEPQAYENGFAQKWLIEDQIDGSEALNYTQDTGLPVMAPILLWGPDMWADGVVPRKGDRLRWCACDFENCFNSHESAHGEEKCGDLLSRFFTTDPTTAVFYPNPGLEQQLVVRAEADAYVRQLDPNANFGSERKLRSQEGPDPIWSYVRFDLSAIPRPVRYAALSFRNATDPPHGGLGDRSVTVVSDTSWNEQTLTWANRPAPDGPTRILPSGSRDATRKLEITDLVNQDADGVLSLAIRAGASEQRLGEVLARESFQEPRIVVIPGAPCAGSRASR